MLFKIVFEIPGQLKREIGWDPIKHPQAVELICSILDSVEGNTTTPTQPQPTAVTQSPEQPKATPTAFAQVNPKSTQDLDTILLPDTSERAGGAYTKRQEALKADPQQRPYNKFTPDQVRMVANALARGHTEEEISGRYNFKYANVRNIRMGNTYLDITGFTPFAERTDPTDSHHYYNRQQANPSRMTPKGKEISGFYKALKAEANERNAQALRQYRRNKK